MSGGTIRQIDCCTCGAKAVTVEHFRQCSGTADNYWYCRTDIPCQCDCKKRDEFQFIYEPVEKELDNPDWTNYTDTISQ